MPLLSPLYLERDPVSVIQGLFSFNLLYKLLPLYSLMRHFGSAVLRLSRVSRQMAPRNLTAVK